MTKKILIPVVLVLLVSMIAGGVALAQSGNNPAQPGATAGAPSSLSNLGRGLAARLARLRNGSAIGQVDSTSQAQLVIRNLSGGQHTYQLDAKTRYLDENGQPATAQELAAGHWVMVQATRSGLTAWAARVVYLLPASFSPPEDLNLLMVGQLTSVSAADGTFSLQARSGQDWNFALGQGAVFLGQTKSLSAVEPGMQVVVAGINAAQGGSPTAYLVFARQRRARYAGSISAVDPANNTFTLTLRASGQDVAIQVTPDTRFRSQNDQYKSLADLQPDMLAAVQAAQQDQGQWVASLVTVATQAQVKDYDLRLLGRISSINGNTLVVANLRGWQYTVQLTGDTRFMGRLTSASDLQVGMVISLAANKVNDVYQAQTILAPQRSHTPQPAPAAPAATP
jgi:Domain of unknown function (DUF5666)